MIYFLCDELTRRIKIGFTDGDLRTRVQTLQTGCPGVLTPLLQIRGMAHVEDDWHKRYAGVRERGEWFRPGVELLRAIEEVKGSQAETRRRLLHELHEMDDSALRGWSMDDLVDLKGNETQVIDLFSEPIGAESVWCDDRLAICVCDLDCLIPTLQQGLLKGRLNIADIVDIQVELDVAVKFSCPLLEAAMVCDVIRERDRKIGDEPTRVYLNRRDTWVRLPSAAVLTVADGGRCQLNREVFAVQFEVEAPVPLE